MGGTCPHVPERKTEAQEAKVFARQESQGPNSALIKSKALSTTSCSVRWGIGGHLGLISQFISGA